MYLNPPIFLAIVIWDPTAKFNSCQYFQLYNTHHIPYLHNTCIPTEVAKVILDKCTLSPPNCPDPEEPYYSVMFNYEFAEDFQNEQQSDRYCVAIHCMVCKYEKLSDIWQ